MRRRGVVLAKGKRVGPAGWTCCLNGTFFNVRLHCMQIIIACFDAEPELGGVPEGEADAQRRRLR